MGCAELRFSDSRELNSMFDMPVHWLVIRSVLALAFAAGMIWGIRGAMAKRPKGLLFATGCGLFLCEQVGTLALYFFGLHEFEQVKYLHRMAQVITWGMGQGLVFAALSSIWYETKSTHVDQPAWSHGKQLFMYAMMSLAILPISGGLALAMLRSSELVMSTVNAALLAVPSLFVWLQASRHLETLRVQPDGATERPITLWAYTVASISSVGALFCALFAFVLLGLQQGWIQP
jgi:uncharacterized membrane protein